MWFELWLTHTCTLRMRKKWNMKNSKDFDILLFLRLALRNITFRKCIVVNKVISKQLYQLQRCNLIRSITFDKYRLTTALAYHLVKIKHVVILNTELVVFHHISKTRTWRFFLKLMLMSAVLIPFNIH